MNRILLLIPAALAGCAMPQWHHANFSPAQFDQDRYQCTVQAREMYPVAMAGQSNMMPPPATRTNCTAMGNQVNCTNQQGYQMPVYQYDRNQPYRDNAFSYCMRARGYWRQ